MGLDMYLNKRHYFNTWDKKAQVKSIVSPHATIKPERVVHIDEKVMYWRKANHIHAWFVANVQEGNDDCGEYEVSWEQLCELRQAVEAVLADHSKAEELLPTQSGFFFVSTDYDEGYYDDLTQTLDFLNGELSVERLVGEDSWYLYHSSW